MMYIVKNGCLGA